MAQQVSEEIEVHYVPLQYYFHKEKMRPPNGQEGFIYKGTTYVPLRFAAYSLDKAVLWDQDTYTVTIQEPTRQEKVLIRDYKLNRIVKELNNRQKAMVNSTVDPTTISVYFESVQYIFDGKPKWPDEESPGMIYKDTLYVPLRFVSESLGLKVTWDQETYTVAVDFAKPKEESKPNKPVEQPNDRTDTPDHPDKPDNPAGGNHPGTNPGPIPGQNPGQSPGPNPPVTNPGGGSGGGNSGGNGNTETPKTSYESIIQDAESEISSLQSKAESELASIVNEFKQTKDVSLITQGQNLLSGFDNEFEGIMNDLTKELSQNGYDTQAVQSYREQYEQVKAQKEQEVINDLFPSK
ncbi:hypothetical protein J2TS4_43340 [Paenibacillus sp. J2TS4]|nr:hypothetical protein J2TS4_43340 [Paenibacillus sp. J2TS4]